ncbi:MAG TPA: ParB/RepB/Spo0J family partition protein [Thermoanaerobaculia bacterium]|nr:ParB/RepB/Spo0J family partition protein [Thermoanaerobaculia bacterium]
MNVPSSPKKRGLGRGLDALLESRPAAPTPPTGPTPTTNPTPPAISAAAEAVTSLPIDRLRPNRLQPRSLFDEQGLEDLAASIRMQGIVQPLIVTPEAEGGYSIVAGERRWRAARRAGLETVPVVVREVVDDRERLELALVENLQRSDLNPVEEAEAYQALQESFGLSQDEVATRVGKARPTVANALRLLRLPDEVRELLREGRLTAGQARPLLALKPQEQIELARRAAAQGLSAREIERLVSLGVTPRQAAKPPTPVEVHAAAAAETLTRRLQTKVEIQRKGRGGVLRLHFHSEEELMRLYDLLLETPG